MRSVQRSFNAVGTQLAESVLGANLSVVSNLRNRLKVESDDVDRAKPSGAKSPGGGFRVLMASFVRDPRGLWLLVVLGAVFLSSFAVLLSKILVADMRPGIAVATVAWAFVVGGAVLFMFPSKLVVTTFGSLLGVSASDLGTGSGLVNKLATAVTAMAQNITALVHGSNGSPDSFIGAMVWLFVGLLLLICLPAFFRE